MIISVRHGDRGDLFDADGNKIIFAIDADTDSGVVTQYCVNEDGKRYKAENGEPAKQTVTYKSPLRFERKEVTE